MKAFLLLSSFLLTALLLTAFDRKGKNVTDEAGRKAILSAGRWQLVDNYALYHPNGQEVKESKWAHVKECLKDNQLIFHANGKVYLLQGKLKCVEMAPAVDSWAVWRLDNPENMLWVDNGGFTQPLYIEFLSDSSLEVNEWHYFGDSAFIKVYKHVFLPGRKN